MPSRVGGLTWSEHAEPGRVDRGSQQEEVGDLGRAAEAGVAPQTVAAAHQVSTLRSPSGRVGVVGPPRLSAAHRDTPTPVQQPEAVIHSSASAVLSPRVAPGDSSRGLR